MADVIPSVVDGLKEHERLALFWALELFSDGEGVEVNELAMTTFRSAPNYSVQIREEAVVRFAQNFIGTNNINLFEPVGDFGNRYKVTTAYNLSLIRMCRRSCVTAVLSV